MLKRIEVAQLKVGMFIQDLDCGWKDHPFFNNSFAVNTEAVLKQVHKAGLRSVIIDTARGLDADPLPQAGPAKKPGKAPGPSRPQVPAVEEFAHSRQVFSQATGIIKHLMHEVRLGRQVQIQELEPMTESLVEAAFRNHYAFSGISRLKNKDEYTFMHCVSVAGLLVAFGRDLGMADDALQQLALGGLLHDIGKSRVPNEVLNKPGRLNEQEFAIMKRHVDFSGEILKGIADLGQIPIEVTLLHHEKIDGSGYPLGLKGEEISTVGKMSAIVDVYDALTSERVYKHAWEPTLTLKNMLEWSPTNLSRELVELFVRCLGIYPVGSTVKLESGLIALVIDQTDDLLRPQLRLLYDSNKQAAVWVRDVDLTLELPADRVLHIVDPAKFGINPAQLLLNRPG